MSIFKSIAMFPVLVIFNVDLCQICIIYKRLFLCLIKLINDTIVNTLIVTFLVFIVRFNFL